jgi:hypothetical protein
MLACRHPSSSVGVCRGNSSEGAYEHTWIEWKPRQLSLGSGIALCGSLCNDRCGLRPNLRFRVACKYEQDLQRSVIGRVTAFARCRATARLTTCPERREMNAARFSYSALECLQG